MYREVTDGKLFIVDASRQTNVLNSASLPVETGSYIHDLATLILEIVFEWTFRLILFFQMLEVSVWNRFVDFFSRAISKVITERVALFN